jgi:hypothetical protein
MAASFDQLKQLVDSGGTDLAESDNLAMLALKIHQPRKELPL